jgi:sec-independent protein translocase protein TatB
MFDIGFSELLLIAVVALVVIGPEKLPRVARTVGHLLGRMQRYVNDVKADINREMALDDLRKLQASMQDTMQSVEQSVNEEMRSAEEQLNRITTEAEAAVNGTGSASAADSAPPAVPSPAGDAPAATTPNKS